MNGSSRTHLQPGRQFKVLGHEIVVHTQRLPPANNVCFVFLLDPYDDRHELKIFRGKGATADEAESSTLREALAYLDSPTAGGFSTILAGKSTLNVAGRKVDIFCDQLPDGRFQAFPFLYRPDGRRVIIMQFHLTEAITGASAAEAFGTCIRRLEEHFAEGIDADGERVEPDSGGGQRESLAPDLS